MRWPLAGFVIISVFATTIGASNSGKAGGSAGPLQQQWRLDPSKPPLYLSLIRRGEPGPKWRGEPGPRVWLQLQNNTKWRVGVFTYGVPPPESKRTTVQLCPRGAVGLIDGEEIEPILKRLEAKKGCLEGDCGMHPALVGLEWLPSGGSAILSVPADALIRPEQEIRVQVAYEWEMKCNEEGAVESVFPTVRTLVVFRAGQVPDSWSKDGGK